MHRVRLIHWNASEAKERAARLRAAGYTVAWFTTSRKDLEQRIGQMGALAGKDGLWILWPKASAGLATDLTQAVVREMGLAAGLVDYKIAAIDATWSGLRFTRRKAG